MRSYGLPKDREGRRIELISVMSFDFRHVISIFSTYVRLSVVRPFFGAKSNFVEMPSCISAKRKNNNNIGPRLIDTQNKTEHVITSP